MTIPDTTSNSLPPTEAPLLDVESLRVEYETDRGVVSAIRDISLTIERGAIHGVAGESGCGKSTLALSILRYLGTNGRIASGSITFDGQSLLDLSSKELRALRGNRIAHIPQDAGVSLNPSIRIGEQIAEVARLHQGLSDEEARQRTIETLESVNIAEPEYNINRYPHELSGGMQQRVVIAMALICDPELLILDEPTTGLDVTTQANILDLIQALNEEYQTSMLLISHDLGVISEIADRVSILYAGTVMETGPVEMVFESPSNPYTQGLLAAIPDVSTKDSLVPIPGRIPDPTNIPRGCAFANRCAFATKACWSDPIPLESVSETNVHRTRCLHWQEARNNPIQSEEPSERELERGERLLAARDVKKYFGKETMIDRLLGGNPPVKAVNGVDLDVYESETVSLVGESGCGKSTLGRTLLKLHEASDGTITFRGTDLGALSHDELKSFKSDAQIVFQNPNSTLNPRKTVYEELTRPLKLSTDLSHEERNARIGELLEQVGLGSEYASRYPHELSGGETQRVAIARAFASEPAFVVLDEPVSALDVSVQASILNMLESIRQEYGSSYLFISHDLSVVNHISDRIAVMYLGEVVEVGSRADVFTPPYHPYTRSLLSSVPSLEQDDDRDRIRLEGQVPSAREPPSGCPFQTRCPQKIGDICEREHPALEAVEDGDHRIACHLEREELEVPLDRSITQQNVD